MIYTLLVLISFSSFSSFGQGLNAELDIKQLALESHQARKDQRKEIAIAKAKLAKENYRDELQKKIMESKKQN